MVKRKYKDISQEEYNKSHSKIPRAKKKIVKK